MHVKIKSFPKHCRINLGELYAIDQKCLLMVLDRICNSE